MHALGRDWLTTRSSVAGATFNPLSTTGLLTPFLIGSCHEMFTCVANYDKALKMLYTSSD